MVMVTSSCLKYILEQDMDNKRTGKQCIAGKKVDFNVIECLIIFIIETVTISSSPLRNGVGIQKAAFPSLTKNLDFDINKETSIL